MRVNILIAIAVILVSLGPWLTPLPCFGEPLKSEKRAIVVGGALNYPPYEFLDEDGKPTGYNVELTRAIAMEMGLDVQISLLPSHSIFQALEEGKIDVLMGVADTEAREATLDFSPPHTIVVFSLFGRKGGPSISSMEAWQDKDVMALKRAVINEMAIENGWKSLTFVDSDEEMLRLLASGKHDYAILATKVGIHLIRYRGSTTLRLLQRLRKFSNTASP